MNLHKLRLFQCRFRYEEICIVTLKNNIENKALVSKLCKSYGNKQYVTVYKEPFCGSK